MKTQISPMGFQHSQYRELVTHTWKVRRSKEYTEVTQRGATMETATTPWGWRNTKLGVGKEQIPPSSAPCWQSQTGSQLARELGNVVCRGLAPAFQSRVQRSPCLIKQIVMGAGRRCMSSVTCSLPLGRLRNLEKNSVCNWLSLSCFHKGGANTLLERRCGV